jgi:diacylglycerol kinase (ATP)
MSDMLYIINPAGRRGAGVKAWKAFQESWSDAIAPEHVIVTEGPGHAREIATSADGYDTFATIGGDGTVGEVISGIMDRGEPDLRIAIIPAGTGNDIGRHVGIRSEADATDALRSDCSRRFDIIRVDSQVNGQAARRYGFLTGAVGFSSIPKIRPWMKRLLGPAGAYYLATVLQILVHQPTNMTMRTEGRERSGRTWLILARNVESTAGGSMRLAPGARSDDGEPKISVFPWGSRISMPTRLMPKIASGEHINEPDVDYFSDRKIEIESDPAAIVELDGDLCGWTPATITVCPSAVRIMTPVAARKNGSGPISESDR